MRHIICFILCLFFSCSAFSQGQLTVSMIKKPSNKTLATLTARAGVSKEESDWHEQAVKATKDYRDIVDSLYKWQKPFDGFSLVWTGLRTFFVIQETSKNIINNISEIAALLNDYEQQCLTKFKIQKEDKDIIRIGRKYYPLIEEQVMSVYNLVMGHFIDPVESTQLFYRCETSDMMVILDDLNRQLVRLDELVASCARELRCFITLRLGWRHRSKSTMAKYTLGYHANAALERWRNNALESLKR